MTQFYWYIIYFLKYYRCSLTQWPNAMLPGHHGRLHFSVFIFEKLPHLICYLLNIFATRRLAITIWQRRAGLYYVKQEYIILYMQWHIGGCQNMIWDGQNNFISTLNLNKWILNNHCYATVCEVDLINHYYFSKSLLF